MVKGSHSGKRNSKGSHSGKSNSKDGDPKKEKLKQKMELLEIQELADKLEEEHYKVLAANIKSCAEFIEKYGIKKDRVKSTKLMLCTLLSCAQNHKLFQQKDFTSVAKVVQFHFEKPPNRDSKMRDVLVNENKKIRQQLFTDMMKILKDKGVRVQDFRVNELHNIAEWEHVRAAEADDNGLAPALSLEVILQALIANLDKITHKLSKKPAPEATNDAEKLSVKDDETADQDIADDDDQDEDSPEVEATVIEDTEVENSAKRNADIVAYSDVLQNLLKQAEGKIKRINPDGVLEGDGFYSKCPSFMDPIECSIEIYPDKLISMLQVYVRNLDDLMNMPNIIGYHTAIRQDAHIMVVFQRYVKTLSEVMLEKQVWEKKEHLGVYGFSEFFMSTLQQLFTLIDVFVTNGIKISELNVESVVYAKADSSFKTPLLRRLFSGDVQCNWTAHYYGLVKNIILQAMKNDGMKMNKPVDSSEETKLVSTEVADFLIQLDHATLKINHFKEHPVFWKKTEKLQFLVDIRNDTRIRPCERKMNMYFEEFADDWQDNVREVPELEAYLDKSISRRKEEIAQRGSKRKGKNLEVMPDTLENNIKGLASYFRNGFEHINDDVTDDPDETKKVLPWKLEELMESQFPDLIPHLYVTLAKEDKSWRPFLKNREL